MEHLRDASHVVKTVDPDDGFSAHETLLNSDIALLYKLPAELMNEDVLTHARRPSNSTPLGIAGKPRIRVHEDRKWRA